MICKRCGKPIPEGLIYCPSCGEKGEEALKDADFSVLKVVANTQMINEMSQQLDADEDYDMEPKFEPMPDPDDLTEEQLEALSPKERKAWEKRRKKKEKEQQKAAKEKARRVKAENPGKKGRAGRFFLVLLLLAALAAGGYFAYITWLTPEARFNNAMLKGREAVENGDYGAAVEAFGKAVAVDSRSKEAYIARANAYMNMGDTTRALDDYIKAYFIDTTDAELCEKLGDAYYQQQIYDNARNYYDSALKLVPQRAELYAKLADVEIASLQRDTALETLEKGIQITEDEELQRKYDALLNNKFEDYMEEAAAAEEGGDLEGAVQSYTLAAALQPERSEAFTARAKAYLAQEKYSEAAADFRTAISLGEKTEENYLSFADAEEAMLGDRATSSRELVELMEEGWQETESELILKRLVAVTPSQPAGNYEETFALSLNSYCNLYYTLDGSAPTVESEKYTRPLEIGVGDTVVTVLPVSNGGVTGEPITLSYNVTTVEMKAMAAFEAYFADHFNDMDQDVFLYDVSDDGLVDMIIVDHNSDDSKLFRVRVYVFDGNVVTPVYNNSKATEETLCLASYDGKYALASLSVTEEEKDKVKIRTETYELYTVLQDNETNTVRSFKVTYEGETLTKSELEGENVRFIRIVGVPYFSQDAFGKFEAPENAYAEGTGVGETMDGNFYTTDEALAALVPGSAFLKLPEGVKTFVLYGENIYYYGGGEDDAKTLYTAPLQALSEENAAQKLGEGDGETLTYSGGWLYVGDGKRFSAADGEEKTDTYPNMDTLVLMDGRYLFYKVKLADGLTRSDRDMFNAVDVLAKYDKDCIYFTTDSGLFQLKTGTEPVLTAYTLNGSYLYETALDLKDLTGQVLTGADGAIFLLQEGGVTQLDSATGSVVKSYEVSGVGKDSRMLATASGTLIIDKDGKGSEYLVLNLGDGSLRSTAQE